MTTSMPYIDITPTISPQIAVWPGDVPFSRSVAMDTEKGDHLTLSSITTTLHVGAHADAPSHFTHGLGSHQDVPHASSNLAIDDLDLTPYLGPCLVLDVKIPRGTLITVDHLSRFSQLGRPHHWGVRLREDPISRVLIRTGSFPDINHFNQDFVAFHPNAIEFLGNSGVKLVGIDTPSVDECSSKDLPSHHALLRYSMRNLEGLDLSKVQEGIYDLIALPLRLKGCDASPVRAILRPLDNLLG